VYKPLFQVEIEKIKPDIVVCDFMTRVAVDIADDLGIPAIINCPGLMSFMNELFGASGIIDYDKASVCCGQIVVK